MTDKEFTSFLGEIENDFAKVRAELDAVERKSDAQALEVCSRYTYQYKKRGLMRIVAQHENTRAIFRALCDIYVKHAFGARAFEKILNGDFIFVGKHDYVSCDEYEYVGVYGDGDIWCRRGKGMFEEATNE